jgi:hypothetical protein
MSSRASLLSLPALALAVGVALGACNTGAVAVSECREIESARCEASRTCGTVEDVEACERFYRDQCLHGISGPEAPTAEAQSSCVEAIQKAGACAEQDPEQSLSACLAGEDAGAAGAPSADDETQASVCEFVGEPWEAPVCDFLNEGAGGAEGE